MVVEALKPTMPTDVELNRLAQRFYEASDISLPSMTDKPKVVAGLRAVFEALTGDIVRVCGRCHQRVHYFKGRGWIPVAPGGEGGYWACRENLVPGAHIPMRVKQTEDRDS